MRTLLIDNYDSFTHNLYHLITLVNGSEPSLIRNDDPHWRPEHASCFDNIVISPGPGHPEKERDLGIGKHIIETAAIPILGVCLGHQGICARQGARVGAAPEPWHGRVAFIRHTGKDIFQGIPSPFRATRYHSLAVFDLPASLEAIAWSDDGLLMGVRHVSRPQWGVQFHPESISTTHGEPLLRNFALLTRQWQHAGKVPSSPVSAPSWVTSRRDNPPPTHLTERYHLLCQPYPHTLPAETLFSLFFASSPHAIWLDSSLHEYDSGRFSFLADGSGPLGRVARASVKAGTVTVQSCLGVQTHHADFFDWLEADLNSCYLEERPQTPFEFALGWLGYIGYEMKAACEGDQGHASPHPDAFLVFCDRGLVIDHETHTIWLLALTSRAEAQAARTWLAQIANRLAQMDEHPPPAPSPYTPPAQALPTLRHDKQAYLALIAQCREALLDGESYELCLTNMVHVPCHVNPWSLWCALRTVNPAPYGAYLKLDDMFVLSCSPERFLHISRSGRIESKPIKGTGPRGETPEQDDYWIKTLKNSEKEQAENRMIVDLVRHDLGRFATPGSVEVPTLFGIESYQTVHQMVSTVTAKLKEGVSPSQCVRAAFPAGSMTGAPKLRTMQILDKLEQGARGVYSGALGYFSLCGAVDLSVVIRTLVIEKEVLSFGVGGAITALSDPVAEFEETRLKASAFTRILNIPFPN
ncbi:MAG: aminodeoxychorismate synthase component I [Burkholderiaceae bacterium]|jgi:para-aminobenzoate synthetase|nr:aminodeoxychorismate synthase component I [Burkholderiaceae bacterium]